MSGGGEWSHGMLGCCDNCGICLKGLICPCLVIGSNASALGESYCCWCTLYTFVPVLNCICRISQRSAIKEKYGIEGGCCDCCIALACCPCAIIQEAQEVADHGDGMATDKPDGKWKV